MSTTDWTRIKRLAGPNSDFPGRQVYLFGSMARLDPSKSWLAQFRAEAEAQGLGVEVHKGHLYVTMESTL